MGDIVFTGIGVISPLGVGRTRFWEACRKGRSGIKRITAFDTSPFRSNLACMVEDFDPAQFVPPSVYRRMSRISRMAVASSVEALADSGLDLEALDKDRVGVVLGTSYGSSGHVDDFYVSLLKGGPRGAQPFLFPETVPNAPTSHIAIFQGITGPNSTFCHNEISAETAMLYAQNLLLHHLVDVVLVGGAEELSPMLFSCYDALGVLQSAEGDHGDPVRPKLNGGIILGEGAATLIMERRDFALKRGARIYGELSSGVVTGGASAMGHYETTGHQMRRAILSALELAHLTPDDIDQVDVSANFSGELDLLEYEQIVAVFGKRKAELAVTPLKYLIGDFGGAGALRAAATLLSLHQQSPLPTVTAETLQGLPGRTLHWTVLEKARLNAALMISSTYGGASAGLVFTRHQENESS